MNEARPDPTQAYAIPVREECMACPTHEQSRAQARVLESIIEVFHAAMIGETQEEVADRCLDVACRLSSSPFGMVTMLNAQGHLDAVAVRHDAWQSIGLTPKKAMLRMQNMAPDEFWTQVIASRRCHFGPLPANLSVYPFKAKNILGVSLVRAGRVIGCLGLANNEGDYSARDMESMETLSVAFAEALSLKRTEMALQELNGHLETRGSEMRAAMEELDAFSYTVSHDLRAPLRHIIGFSELLKRDFKGQLQGKAAHYMETILASSRHMGRLIDVLLDFSQSGRKPLLKKRVNLKGLVEEVIAAMELDLLGRRVAWEVGSLPYVSADPVLLRSVLVNLMSNALKFTRNREEARISIGSRVEGAETVVFIGDNGAGFNPRYKDKLFGVFQRLHSATQFEGAGVGLANVRRIILRHGGRTWATGELEVGATFFFTLPSLPQRTSR